LPEHIACAVACVRGRQPQNGDTCMSKISMNTIFLHIDVCVSGEFGEN